MLFLARDANMASRTPQQHILVLVVVVVELAPGEMHSCLFLIANPAHFMRVGVRASIAKRLTAKRRFTFPRATDAADKAVEATSPYVIAFLQATTLADRKLSQKFLTTARITLLRRQFWTAAMAYHTAHPTRGVGALLSVLVVHEVYFCPRIVLATFLAPVLCLRPPVFAALTYAGVLHIAGELYSALVAMMRQS